jgi:glycosyltransferase involved in cell wall biosynthesis
MASAEPLDILHLDDVTEWRGGQQQVIYLHEGLLAKGARSELLCQPDSKLAEYCRDKNLPFTTQAMKGEFDFRAAYRIAKYASQNGFRIIHSHSAHATMLGIWAKYFLPTLKHIAHRRVDFSIRKPIIGALKYNNRRVDRIICISEAIRRVMFADGVNPGKMATIRSGINIHKFDGITGEDRLRQSFGIPDDHLIVGIIAALAGHKDYPTLLRAAKQVIEQFDKVTFCAAGDGPEKEKLFALHNELKLGDHFRFLGFRSDVGALLKIFDIFTLSSHKEGLGTSALDAMMVGLPVVATRAGGIPEMIEHEISGLLTATRNEGELAAALLTLLNAPELRKRLGQAAKQSVRHFDIENTIAKTVELYESVLE